MRNDLDAAGEDPGRLFGAAGRHGLPRPTPQFRRRAWLAFQRALDPLAAPKPHPSRPRR